MNLPIFFMLLILGIWNVYSKFARKNFSKMQWLRGLFYGIQPAFSYLLLLLFSFVLITNFMMIILLFAEHNHEIITNELIWGKTVLEIYLYYIFIGIIGLALLVLTHLCWCLDKVKQISQEEPKSKKPKEIKMDDYWGKKK